MNKEDKQRVIGKIVAISTDRFTVELLAGIDNFNVSGYDDIHYFAQLNSYVVIPYQNYYIVAEVINVREKDLNVSALNPSEQFLSKARSGKYIDVFPIGTLKSIVKDGEVDEFTFGVSIYPALYTDALYIKEKELDAIFNVTDKEEIVCSDPSNHKDPCQQCEEKRFKTLAIGRSSIFPDYEVKIDIDKFFGGHGAILGNTGSGKSCTIASILQGLFKLHSHSATGSTFVILDVNGEYSKAFANVTAENSDIAVSNFYFIEPTQISNAQKFILPHWFLTIDEWALLLQATEKTHLPILRNALGLAALFSDDAKEVAKTKNHILATCISQILRDETSSPSKSDRILSILKKFNTEEITLTTAFSFIDQQGAASQSISYGTGNNIARKTCTIENCLFINFGQMIGTDQLFQFIESIDNMGVPVFLKKNFEMPVYEKQHKFDFTRIIDAIDIAILYEEAHGNKQIRDYCSSLLTRVKSIKERPDYEFIKHSEPNYNDFVKMMLGLSEDKKDDTVKKKQIIIIDLSGVEDEIVEVVSCVLSRIIYDTLKTLKERNSFPVNLILEEAHRYIGDDPKRLFLRANKIFDLIAKEGRKFGLLLLLSSQRPSELSKTVLSQCNNFIVHRIQNPEDLSHIRQITPHVSEAILKRMPSIPTQHALIFGHAVNLPTTFRVNDADPLPKSDNNRISENWFKLKDHIVDL